MVKKLKSLAGNPTPSQLSGAIKESASQIWLAGLGAFAKAQEEGGKVFEALVKEGGTLHRRTRKLTDDKVAEVGEKVGKVAGDFSKQANGKWDKLEQVFEDRVARALSSLGVPTKKELNALQARLDALAPAKKAAAKKVAKKAVAKKTATKPVRRPAAKKAPAKKAA